MTASGPLTVLCIASYEKGHEFLREAKRQGCTVLLLTSESLMKTASWPTESIDDIFYMPDVNKKWNLQHTILAVTIVPMVLVTLSRGLKARFHAHKRIAR